MNNMFTMMGLSTTNYGLFAADGCHQRHHDQFIATAASAHNGFDLGGRELNSETLSPKTLEPLPENLDRHPRNPMPNCKPSTLGSKGTLVGAVMAGLLWRSLVTDLPFRLIGLTTCSYRVTCSRGCRYRLRVEGFGL